MLLSISSEKNLNLKYIAPLLASLMASSGAFAGTPSFQPAVLDFGAVPVGSSATLSVNLRLASGSDRLRSIGINAAQVMTWATSFGDFQLSQGTCNAFGASGTPLSTMSNCNFSLTYSPTAPGKSTAVVTVTDHFDGHWGTMTVSATGLAPASVPTLSQWSLAGLSAMLAMAALVGMRRRP